MLAPYLGQPSGSSVESTWLGSLVEHGAGAAGLLYRRNRYYDPQSGRFTQQDPIGIAGGVNVYGFAAGDPVSYSDPFGLCPPEDQNLSDCPSSILPFIELGRNARATNQAVGLFAGLGLGGGTIGAVARTLFGGGAALTTLGLGGAPVASAVGGIVSQVRAAGGTPGSQIFEAGRLVGELGLSQGRATQAVRQAISGLGFQTGGPPLNVNGVNYILARDAFGGQISAIGVHADGTTTRAAFDLSLKLIRDMGAIGAPR